MSHLKLGIVGGLGVMASPMARHWKVDGPARVLRVHDRGGKGANREKSREQWREHGASFVSSYEDLVGHGELDGIIVCAGKNGDDLNILSSLAKAIVAVGSRPFICHMSTVSTGFAESANRFLSAKGIEYANYPLTGGALGAERGTMLILGSGSQPLFERLEPALKCIGNPRFFGTRPSAGAEVKFMGHLMVFNGLMGIGLAVAVHSEAFQQGHLGGPDQSGFFEFLNGGAGGTRQWEIVLKFAVQDNNWTSGFSVKYGAVDAIYTAALCADLGLPSISVDAVVNVALGFSFVINEVSDEGATQTLAREMLKSRASDLDRFVLKHSAPRGDVRGSIEKCILSLPERLRAVVKLDVGEKDFWGGIIDD